MTAAERKKRIARMEQWLDDRRAEWLFTGGTMQMLTYQGALEAMEILGYECARDQADRHHIYAL